MVALWLVWIRVHDMLNLIISSAYFVSVVFPVNFQLYEVQYIMIKYK